MPPAPVDGPTPVGGGDNPRPTPFTRLAIAVAANAGEAVIRVAGDLDAAGGRDLCAAAEKLVDGKYRRVVLDLSAVTYSDLAGVRALAEVGVLLDRAGIELTIRNANAATYPVDWRAIPHSHE